MTLLALRLVLSVALSTTPNGLDGVLRLEQAGHDEAALALAEQLCSQPPASALPQLEAARLGIKLGRDTTFVEKHLQAARALTPDNPRLRFLSAQVKEGAGEEAAARQLYMEAVSLRSNYTEARTRLVAMGIRDRDWVLAETQLRALLAGGESSVGRRLQLARVLEEQSKLVEAESQLVSLHRDEPMNASATAALADFYARHNRMREAEALRRPPATKKLRPLPPSRH